MQDRAQFFCYEVNPFMASQFEDSVSLVDDSCKFKVSKCVVPKKIQVEIGPIVHFRSR